MVKVGVEQSQFYQVVRGVSMCHQNVTLKRNCST